jgi:hypothetical protein
MPVISAILFSGNENVQNWHFIFFNQYLFLPQQINTLKGNID